MMMKVEVEAEASERKWLMLMSLVMWSRVDVRDAGSLRGHEMYVCPSVRHTAKKREKDGRTEGSHIIAET